MTTSTAILFAMDTKKLPGYILEEAEERHRKRSKEGFKEFLRKKCDGMQNVILENLPNVNGLPVSAFLSRMNGYTPYFRHNTTPVTKIIEDQIALLKEIPQNNEDGDILSVMSAHAKIRAVRILCKLAAGGADYEKMSEWTEMNAAELNEAIATAMNTDGRDLMLELCIGIAFLVRKFRFKLYDKLELVVAALVRSMAIGMIPWESYVEQFRDAKEYHNDLELARGRQIMFHYPRMEYQFHEVNHRLLGCVYYTLADLFFSCPSPKLIHFFECRIFRRKEMTRNLLFTILNVVVINLADLQAEAEQLSLANNQPSTVNVPTGPSTTPLMSRRGRIYSETMWNELPAVLYSDIIRVYNDRNRSNKVLINEIMAMLRSHAPDKLPLFEEATLKALEMYTGAGGGRLPETYQIGKPAASRDGEVTPTGSTGTSVGTHRKRKSLAGVDLTGIVVDKGHPIDELAGRRRSSRINTMTPEHFDKTEKSSISSDTDSKFTTESQQQLTGINRRTMIVPKIPELLAAHRGLKK